MDVASEHDPWMLPEGSYIIRVGLARVDGDGKIEQMKLASADVQVYSKAEARYYFNQYTDLARKVRKLNRAVGRLFPNEKG